MHDKLTGKIICNSEKLKEFPLKLETRQECPLSPLLLNFALKVLTLEIRQGKKKKEILIERIQQTHRTPSSKHGKNKLYPHISFSNYRK